MNTKVNFAGIEMKNPVTVASGTFGYGREYNEYIDFCKQMKKWYGDSFSLYCLDAYAATCLANTNWQTWETEVFEDFEMNEHEAIEQGRVSLRTAKKMLLLCKHFEPIIKEKCLSNE